MQDAGCMALRADPRSKMQDAGYRIQDKGWEMGDN